MGDYSILRLYGLKMHLKCVLRAIKWVHLAPTFGLFFVYTVRNYASRFASKLSIGFDYLLSDKNQIEY